MQFVIKHATDKRIDTTKHFLDDSPLRLLVLVPGNMAIMACDGKWEPRYSQQLQHFTETFNHSSKFLNITTIETTVQVYQPTDTHTFKTQN